VFSNLPKTSTGKIQKFVLRDMAKQLNEQPASKA
jgi:fatty-acyl-CoA synthase